MSAPYNVLDVANYVIFINNKLDDYPQISNLRLQKILYFIQVIYLRFHGKLFFLDKIEAWKYGPVVPDVYRTFAIYGSRQIKISDEVAQEAQSKISDEDKKFIQFVLGTCRKYSINQLVDITNKHDAWSSSYNNAVDHTITEEKLRKQAKYNG